MAKIRKGFVVDPEEAYRQWWVRIKNFLDTDKIKQEGTFETFQSEMLKRKDDKSYESGADFNKHKQKKQLDGLWDWLANTKTVKVRGAVTEIVGKKQVKLEISTMKRFKRGNHYYIGVWARGKKGLVTSARWSPKKSRQLKDIYGLK